MVGLTLFDIIIICIAVFVSLEAVSILFGIFFK